MVFRRFWGSATEPLLPLPVLVQQQEEQYGDESAEPVFAELVEEQTDIFNDTARSGEEDIDHHQRRYEFKRNVGDGAHQSHGRIKRSFYTSHRQFPLCLPVLRRRRR